MAVGMFILSQRKRKGLAALFAFLCAVQIILGCGMTGSSLYVIIAVAPVLHAEKSEVNFVFAVTGLYGTHVIFHWIVGINIGQRCLKQASRKSTGNLFVLWTTMGTNTIIQLLVLSHFARKMNKYIARSLKQSLANGMNQYLQDITWKEMIDKLQYANECCGSASYEDWHETKWLTKYHVDLKSDIIKQLKPSEVEAPKLPVTPWSCCKVDFPLQCLHDPIQQREFSHIWTDEPNIITDSINTKGCLDSMRRPIEAVIRAFVASSSVMCLVHILIFVVSRILYTSARNSAIMGEPRGLAPGWVFGRGDFGYSGGKSIIEIMETHGGFSTNAESSDDDNRGYKNEDDENALLLERPIENASGINLIGKQESLFEGSSNSLKKAESRNKANSRIRIAEQSDRIKSKERLGVENKENTNKSIDELKLRSIAEELKRLQQ
ncbi:unnamed protein product [Phyllotreta striolata]|uniref:Uncharacterized protein n=1 Tax=Phyllotreta striolata TaxID=444603 RepID=A0A9N9XU37_PHYSR|nr:unnamed protein product [Phyllotreta striolata]